MVTGSPSASATYFRHPRQESARDSARGAAYLDALFNFVDPSHAARLPRDLAS